MAQSRYISRLAGPLIAAVAASFFAGLAANVPVQATSYLRSLDSLARIAVFPDKTPTVGLDVIKENLINREGVEDVRFISREKVLENALASDPALKEFVIPGDNPFTAYFILKPSFVDPQFAQTVVESIKKIPGVKQAVYDQSLFKNYAALSAFAHGYSIVITGASVCLCVVALGVVIVGLARRAYRPSNLIDAGIAGVSAAVLSSGLLYLAGNYVARTNMLVVSGESFALIIAVAVSTALISGTAAAT